MKNFFLTMLFVLIVLMSVGCVQQQGPLMFEGNSQRVDVIEEEIEDRLEEENNDIELEVEIIEEVEED